MNTDMYTVGVVSIANAKSITNEPFAAVLKIQRKNFFDFFLFLYHKLKRI
jgi:hypothetical protein